MASILAVLCSPILLFDFHSIIRVVLLALLSNSIFFLSFS